VLTTQEMFDHKDNASLYINIGIVGLGGSFAGLYAYDIEVALVQPVLLRRDSTIQALGYTWSVDSLGTIGRSNVRQLRNSVADLVNHFINAYLSMNPASRGGGSTSPPPPVKEKRR
jgi:hypothetical protein